MRIYLCRPLVIFVMAALAPFRANADRAFILTPDDAANRIVALDAQTGASIRDLVPPSDKLVAPLDCIVVGPATVAGVQRATVLLVSDLQARKLVAFNPDNGEYLADFATGVDARGLALAHDGKLLVAGGKTGVKAYDLQTAQQTTRVAARIVDGPNNAFAVLVRPAAALPDAAGTPPFPDGDLLVADVTLDTIFRYDAAGVPRGIFAKLPEFTFVEQLALRANGHVLAADTFGGRVYEFDGAGALLRTVEALRPRGVIELAGGDILISTESGVLQIAADGSTVATPLAGYPTVAPRFLARIGCRGIRGDLDGDGRISNFDVDPFVLALIDPDQFALRFPAIDRVCAGDINNDGRLDLFDIDPFVDCIVAPPELGLACP